MESVGKNSKLIDTTIETYDKTADNYTNTHNDVNQIKNLLDIFTKNIPGKKILDVGSGPGRDAKYFSEKGFDVLGIDLSSRFIEIWIKTAPKAKFIRMDMRKLSLSEESFDGIWACTSFLHVPKEDAAETLRGFWRVLKQKGLLYLSVKQGNEERVIRTGEYLGGQKFFAFYTEAELKGLVESCGFKIFQTVIEHKKDVFINIFARKAI